MRFEFKEWRLHFVLLSMFGISSGVSTPVSSAATGDLANLAAEHRGQGGDSESLYPSPEVSDSSFVWRAGQGTYRLGVQAPDHWRVENRNVDGSVWGQYFYKTPDGGQVNVQYNAGAPTDPNTSVDNEFLRHYEGEVGGAGQLLSSGHLDNTDKNEALRSLLRELQAREQAMPYGALKAASEGQVALRDGDLVDEELNAVVTFVRPQDQA